MAPKLTGNADGAGAERALAIVDIDGVVADVRHRLRHIERRPKDWNAFFLAAADDPPHEEGLAVVARLAVEFDVVFVTGRPEWLRDITQRWLDRHGLGGHGLVMRRTRDRAPARVVKPAAVARLAEERPIHIVVDDDHDVLQAMAARGWPTFRANWERWGPEERAALHAAQERDGRT